MKSIRTIASTSALCILLISVQAQAATVTGTVTNKTTGKPAAGDAVVLVEPMTGMSEVGRTTTNAQGRYKLNLPGSNPYLIRVTHQGADYFISAPQSGSGDVSVYDVAAKVNGVSIDEHVIGVEAGSGQLQIFERYTVHNSSSPQRTQWSKRSFEAILPEDAVLHDASAQRPGSETLATTVKLDSGDQKGHYFFNFPIEPDADGKGTLFQVIYELPYSGSKYSFHSLVTLPANTTWVMLPKSMKFEGGGGAGFSPSQQDPGFQTFLSRNAMPGKELAFTVSGTGLLPREDQSAQGGSGGQQAGGPGGGIGTPINTPDPLSKYKWWILGGLALLLAGAAAFLLRKPPAAGAAAAEIPTVYSAQATPAQVSPGAKNAALLSALKEELFALESDRIAGALTQAEYAEQKTALETVLKRALKRNQ